MYQQDYIMRLIQEIIRAILKLLFHIDTDAPTVQLLEDAAERETVEKLLQEIESGNICQAENELYDLVEDSSLQHLLSGLIFYSCLNQKEDAFLAANHFSREEIQDGLSHLASVYGLDGLTDSFVR